MSGGRGKELFVFRARPPSTLTLFFFPPAAGQAAAFFFSPPSLSSPLSNRPAPPVPPTDKGTVVLGNCRKMLICLFPMLSVSLEPA